jgi:hypothetical protein
MYYGLKYIGLSSVVRYACKIIWSLSVAVYVVGTLHKSELDLLQAKTLTNADQRNKGHAMMEIMFLTRFICFHPTVVRSVMELYPRCVKVKCILLSKGQ